jgi:hypothetical protein
LLERIRISWWDVVRRVSSGLQESIGEEIRVSAAEKERTGNYVSATASLLEA